MNTARLAPILAASLCIAPAALAQGSAVVDEGTFTISRAGVPVGRESFRVIRAPAPGGQVYQATGTSVIGETKATSRLGTDSAGRPVAYESDVTEGGQLVQRLRGRGRPSRFSVLAQTRTGESAREYVLPNGTLVLDEDVFHQFFFVGLAAESGELVVISPRTAQQNVMRLRAGAEETVEIAGRALTARRYLLEDARGPRHVWIDSEGRLLKVEIPDRGYVALRDDPPKQTGVGD